MDEESSRMCVRCASSIAAAAAASPYQAQDGIIRPRFSALLCTTVPKEQFHRASMTAGAACTFGTTLPGRSAATLHLEPTAWTFVTKQSVLAQNFLAALLQPPHLLESFADCLPLLLAGGVPVIITQLREVQHCTAAQRQHSTTSTCQEVKSANEAWWGTYGKRQAR
jgi:hypothetical protein